MEHVSVSPPLWISGTDENGKLVSREVIQAAHRIWTRVLQHLRYHGQDIAPAAEILESACHCVSRAIRRKRCGNHIRSLESYLFWAFVRKYNRQMIREGRIQYVESVEVFADRAERHPPRPTTPGQHLPPPLLRCDGRDRHGAAGARRLACLRLVAPPRHPADPLVPARGGGLRRRRGAGPLVRLDSHRGRPPALDRPGLHAHRRSGHPRPRDLVQLCSGPAALRDDWDDRDRDLARHVKPLARGHPRPRGPPVRPA